MVRTLELILGLPPMSQYDASAVPMWRCFSDSADIHPFTARVATVDLNTRNLTDNRLMEQFGKFDLTHADDVPDGEFNRLLWQAIKGEAVAVSPVTRGAFVRTAAHRTGD
jgi:hypothetical protein